MGSQAGSPLDSEPSAYVPFAASVPSPEGCSFHIQDGYHGSDLLRTSHRSHWDSPAFHRQVIGPRAISTHRPAHGESIAECTKDQFHSINITGQSLLLSQVEPKTRLRNIIRIFES